MHTFRHLVRVSEQRRVLHAGWIEEHEIWWGDYLKDYEHLDLFYEDLNYGILKVVEEFMGRNRNRNRTIDSDHKKLRDELTEQWVERFRSEFQSYEGRTLPE